MKINNGGTLGGSILEGDSLYVLKELEDNSADQLVTDPPY